MAKRHRPRRGSLAFTPRKRARSEICRIKRETIVDGGNIQGFAGYKAGMTHIILTDNVTHSITKGMEISIPVTVIETPPMRVEGFRLYKTTHYGKQTVTEAYDDLSKIEERIKSNNTGLELRMISSTLPKVVNGVPKKKQEVMETQMGGDIGKDLEYAKEMLGKEITAKDIFNEGDFVDATAVTKGKGTQGPVKRWGITIQNAKARRSGKGRHVGAIGGWTPRRVRWRVPQLGQTGYQQRTEYNKRIVKIGENGEEITPKGGFLNYGVVRNDYVLLKGSVPGPKKRLVRLSRAIRAPPKLDAPDIVYISKESQQGG
ncbi:large subunit ribosomal protein L3 [Methanophagales archaeon]|nr:large subunit ribosomal protein L3 [Methanophagales archaeon]